MRVLGSRFALLVGIASLAGLSACADLKVYQVGEAHQAGEPGSLAYALPKKSFLLSATYVLKNCQTVDDAQQPLILEADVSINLVASNEVDESQRYYIPYSSLRSAFKEMNFTVESYPNQTLKSFNATVNDQASAILTAAFGTAIKLAVLAKVAAEAAPKTELCDKAAILDLKSVAAMRDRLAKLAKQSKPGGGKLPAKPAKPAPDPEPQPDIDMEITQLQAKIGAIVAAKMTTKVLLAWSPTPSELTQLLGQRRMATKSLPRAVGVQKWLSPAGRKWLSSNQDAGQDLVIAIDVPAWATGSAADAVGTTALIDGFVVRDPALGNVRVCKGACPVPQDGLSTVDNVLFAATVAMPQFGRKLLLPLHNNFAQNSVLDVSLSEDGVITKLGVKSASTLAQPLKDVGTSFDALAKAKSDAQTAEKNKARDDNKVLSDCLEAQKTIIKDGGTPIGSCQ
jgi:hypothetical protein